MSALPENSRLFTCVLAAGLALLGPSARAEDELPRSRWGFKGLFTLGDAGSDYGRGLESFVSGDYQFFRESPKGAWRYGLGLGFGSFALKPPFEGEEEFALLQTYAFGTRVFRADRKLRPYLQLQAGLARTHLRSLLFALTPLPEDLEPGDSPTKPANGFGVGLFPGIEWSLGGGVSLGTAAGFTYFNTEEYDLSPIGQPPASSGTTFGARFGLV